MNHMKKNNTCGDCVNMHELDGYCGRQSRYVNFFDDAPAACFVSRTDVEETIAAAPKPATPGTKVCKDCGRELPLEQCPKHGRSRDGRNSVCMECFSKKMRKAKSDYWADKPHKEKPKPEILPDGQKRCKRCGRVLPVTEFGKHKNTYDHLHPLCNECRSEVGRETYERTCAKKGVAPKPPKSAVSAVSANSAAAESPQTPVSPVAKVTEYVPAPLSSWADEALVEELRRRGWTVTCTKEI